MYILPFSASGIANAVWNRSFRVLTSLIGSGIIQATATNASIPATAIYDTAPSSGVMLIASMAVQASAAGASRFGLYNGTTFVNGLPANASANTSQLVMGWQTLRPAVHNEDAVNASTVSYSGATIV